MKYKRVFISDIHIGEGRSINNPKYIHPYDWLTNKDRTQFSTFLNGLAHDPSVNEVIFLGDLFDTWVYPIYEAPATFASILVADCNKTVINALEDLAKAKDVVYVPGNHDMTAWEQQNISILTAIHPNYRPTEKYETDDGIFAAHGHSYMVFNAEDKQSDPVHNLPLGHYISRLAATLAAQGKMEYLSPDFITNVIAELLKILSTGASGKDIVNGVFDFFKMQSGGTINDNTEITTFDPNSVTVGKVIETYKNMFENWEQRTGQNIREALMSQMLSGLDFVSEGIVRREGKRVVIFGHTHKRCDWPVGDKEYPSGQITKLLGEYGNCGTWCESNTKPYTYIVTESENGEHEMTLEILGK